MDRNNAGEQKPNEESWQEDFFLIGGGQVVLDSSVGLKKDGYIKQYYLGSFIYPKVGVH